MLEPVARFFRTGPDRPVTETSPEKLRRTYERHRWSVFLSVTFGYGFFYVCRVNFSVAKKPMLDEGVLNATQMGIIGSAMLVVYAVGKLANGFLADRANIRRFMSTGLLLSALVNLALGWMEIFWVFVALWAANGWFQSTGSAPSVVALSQWFSNRERGTRYGIWSVSHSIGEGITFVGTGALVAALGWRWGFWGPGIAGVAVALLLYRTLADRPQTYGLPSVADYRQDYSAGRTSGEAVGVSQLAVLKTPAIWVLGLASACMYVARYGVNNWGPLYLQSAKGYDALGAGAVLGVYPVLAMVGAASSGLISDRVFGSRRNVPVLLYGLLEILALVALFLVPPGHAILDSVVMGVFGFALGGLLVFLGGLMAVDIASKRAAGAAMGVVGMFSYAGAALQDTVSGVLIDAGTTAAADGVSSTDFHSVAAFWIGASVLSLLLTLTLWNVKAHE